MENLYVDMEALRVKDVQQKVGGTEQTTCITGYRMVG